MSDNRNSLVYMQSDTGIKGHKETLRDIWNDAVRNCHDIVGEPFQDKVETSSSFSLVKTKASFEDGQDSYPVFAAFLSSNIAARTLQVELETALEKKGLGLDCEGFGPVRVRHVKLPKGPTSP